MKTLTALLIATFLLSCGAEPEKSTNQEAYQDYVKPQEKTQTVEAFVELPKCTEQKEERLVYLIPEEELLICRDGDWHYFDDNEKLQANKTTPVQTSKENLNNDTSKEDSDSDSSQTEQEVSK